MQLSSLFTSVFLLFVVIYSNPVVADDDGSSGQATLQDRLGPLVKTGVAISGNIWKTGVEVTKCIIHNLPSYYDQLRAYSADVYSRIRDETLKLCERFGGMEQLNQVGRKIREVYYKIPVDRLLNAVKDRMSPEQLNRTRLAFRYTADLGGKIRAAFPADDLRNYTAQLAHMAMELAQKVGKAPVEEVKAHAALVYEASRVFAQQVHSDTPGAEIHQLGADIWTAAKTLKDDVITARPPAETADMARSLAKASIAFVAAAGDAKSVPGAAKELVNYAKESFRLWRDYIVGGRYDYEMDDAFDAAQSAINMTQFHAYVAQVSAAAATLKDESVAMVAGPGKQYAEQVYAAAKKFGQNVKEKYPEVAMREYAKAVFAASKDYAKVAGGQAPVKELATYAGKVFGAGKEFVTGAARHLPARKLEGFASEMYKASVVYVNELRPIVPGLEELKTTVHDGIKSVWKFTNELYVKINVDDKHAIFEKVPVHEWAAFLSCKADALKQGSVELYLQYVPKDKQDLLRTLKDDLTQSFNNMDAEKTKAFLETGAEKLFEATKAAYKMMPDSVKERAAGVAAAVYSNLPDAARSLLDSVVNRLKNSEGKQ